MAAASLAAAASLPSGGAAAADLTTTAAPRPAVGLAQPQPSAPTPAALLQLSGSLLAAAAAEGTTGFADAAGGSSGGVQLGAAFLAIGAGKGRQPSSPTSPSPIAALSRLSSTSSSSSAAASPGLALPAELELELSEQFLASVGLDAQPPTLPSLAAVLGSTGGGLDPSQAAVPVATSPPGRDLGLAPGAGELLGVCSGQSSEPGGGVPPVLLCTALHCAAGVQGATLCPHWQATCSAQPSRVAGGGQCDHLGRAQHKS